LILRKQLRKLELKGELKRQARQPKIEREGNLKCLERKKQHGSI
jgi:hypothetical protein